MTFTPGGAGLPALTTVIVRVTNSAVDAVSGNAMFAPYQLQFHTACRRRRRDAADHFVANANQRQR